MTLENVGGQDDTAELQYQLRDGDRKTVIR